MTTQKVTNIDVEEVYGDIQPDKAVLTLENADGETYTVEDDITDDSREYRGRKGDPEHDLVQSAVDKAMDALESGEDVWVDVNFDSPSVQTGNLRVGEMR